MKNVPAMAEIIYNFCCLVVLIRNCGRSYGFRYFYNIAQTRDQYTVHILFIYVHTACTSILGYSDIAIFFDFQKRAYCYQSGIFLQAQFRNISKFGASGKVS